MVAFVLRGQEFQKERADVVEAVKRLKPGKIQKYYVVIAGNKYPIRQVLSVLTGLKPIAITSQDAYRILSKFDFTIDEQ